MDTQSTRELDFPKAVIFDMDGLLADTEPVHAECFRLAFAEWGVSVTHEEYRQNVTIRGVAASDLYVSKGGRAEDWEGVKIRKDSLMREMVPLKGRMMPGVEQFLGILKSAAIPTAVATSSRKETLAIVLDAFSLRSRFDVLATKSEVNVEKPDPAVFLLAAKKLEVDPSRCVVMEDSPKGVIAAHRAGMKCIAIPTPFTADGDCSLATLVVKSLEDVDLDTLRGL